MEVKLTVPVDPHVMKYLQKELKFAEEIKLTKSNMFLSYLYHLLRVPRGLAPRRKETPDHYFKIILPDYLVHKNRIHLSDEAIWDFNNLVDSVMKRSLVERIRMVDFANAAKNEPGTPGWVKMADIIRNFMDEYGLSDADIQYDTLKKEVYRRRKDLNTTWNPLKIRA